MKQGSTAVESPNNVGGRRCHPPRVERVWAEKVNHKERRAAFQSALAATASNAMVSQRGHRFKEELTLPLVVENDLETEWLKGSEGHEGVKTRRSVRFLRGLGVEEDLLRAKNGRHIRAGRGKARGRKYRTPRSLLVVLSQLNGIERAFQNLPGVEVTSVAGLNTEMLAPGGDPGRLTLFTTKALEDLNGRLESGTPATPGGDGQ